MRRTLSHESGTETTPIARAATAPTRFWLTRLLLVAVLLSSACEPAAVPEAPSEETAAFVWPSGDHPVVTLEIEGRGPITLELYPELAPKTVANFLTLAGQDFYDGTTFHRVMRGFMIQGGDPNSRDRDPRNDGFGGSGTTIPDERSAAPHVRGAVSMANTGNSNSATSQFFIVVQDSLQLDGKYSLFGRVIDGMAVVDAISEVEVDEHGRWGRPDRPLENVVIRDVVVGGADGLAGTDGAPSESSAR